MSRLLIISNRLPFSLDRTEDGWQLRQSSGGLVSAIKSYVERSNDSSEEFSEKIWVGSMDATEEEWAEAITNSQPASGFQIEAIFPDKEEYDAYYNGFSNSTLWPIFHYFPMTAEYKKEQFEA